MKLSGSTARLLIKIVVSAGLLAFILGKISIDDLTILVKTLDRRYLVAAGAVFFLSNLLSSFQWHLLLTSSGVRLSFGQSFRFYFVGLFFNNFLPANIGGDAVKVYDVTRIGSSVYQVVAVTLLDRLIGIFSLCLLACGATIFVMQGHSFESLALYLGIFLACMAPLVAFYFVRPLGRVLRWIVGRIRPLSLDKRGAAILDHMGDFKGKRRFVTGLVVFSLLIQSLRVLTHVLVGLAIGVTLSAEVLALFFVFVPILSLAMIPPITINGLGVREGLGILLFAQAGIQQTDAFALEFITYLVSVAISLLGLIFFLLGREVSTRSKADSTTT